MAKTIKYYKVNKLTDADFKRVTGVSRDTFKLMLEVVINHYRTIKSNGGRKSKLSYSDQILMTLEYYREYRTYKHIGVDYRLSESSVHYAVKKIEEVLIKDERFHLPSLKKTQPINEDDIDVIVIDVTESPCERPKKSKENTTQVKRKDIR
jgi:hypothetical protein